MIRIQYASNLFVNQHSSWRQAAKKLAPSCENLALCGNIGIPSSQKMNEFLTWCSYNWELTFWVPGPMELSSANKQDYSVPNNRVKILHKTAYNITERTTILGVPLWTPYPSIPPNMNERGLYFTAYRSPFQLQRWHEEQYAYLQKNIAKNEKHGKKSILLTHHLPHSSLLNAEQWTDRNILLYSARAQQLFANESVTGMLAGAGGQTITSIIGKYDIPCSVNGAFICPDMVPNPHFRSDMVAEFVDR